MILCNKLVPYGEGLLTPCPTPSWRTTPCRLSATAYSVYSQLPYVAGGCLTIYNLRMGTPLTWTVYALHFLCWNKGPASHGEDSGAES
jgi:hypothetical protein